MRPTLPRTLLGGLVGTVLITWTMYAVAPLMSGYRVDIAQMLAPVAVNWMGGLMVHFINGTVVFPLVYAAFVYRYLAGPPTVKGMCWGTALWLLGQSVVLPLLGRGFFSADAGGFMAVVSSLVGHLLYGGALGAVADGPRRKEVPVRRPVPHG